jgi:predicted AlkP superfamily pyrophosphatase or phosphodiesterase
LPGEDQTFPHQADTTKANRYEYFKYLPDANTYTLEMAKAAIAGERLGQTAGITDLLTVSLSPTDYIGHAAGANSIELEDMYLRLDRDLAKFLAHLDATIGKGQYLLFLTADHGVAHIPSFLKEHKIPAGTFDDGIIRKNLNAHFLNTLKAPNVIASIINYQVYLNDSVIAANKINKQALKQEIIDSLMRYDAIAHAFDAQNMGSATLPQPVRERIINGYNQKLSGDIQFLFKPQWFDGWNRGASHGVWNPYDARIPLLWFGWNVKRGKTNREVYMTDIAPTLAALLHLQMPNANIGKVIEELVP